MLGKIWLNKSTRWRFVAITCLGWVDAALNSIRGCRNTGKLHILSILREWYEGLLLWWRRHPSCFTDNKSQELLPLLTASSERVCSEGKHLQPGEKMSSTGLWDVFPSLLTHCLAWQVMHFFNSVPKTTVYLLCNFIVFFLAAESNCTWPPPCPSKTVSPGRIRTPCFKPNSPQCNYMLLR